MNKITKLLVGAAMLASVSFADTGTASNGTEDGNPWLAVVDVVLVRPVSFVGTSVGFVGYAATSPFTAMAGVADESWDTLVEKPAAFTLDRGLGNFR